tara:strand:+ start:73 stop:444 length:372 start_codon:yes stop_codon:yes gene_type:complete
MKKLLLLLLVPMLNAETKYFVCEDIPNTTIKVFNNLLQVNIKEKWIQFDDFRSHEEDFLNDNFSKEITGATYGYDGDGTLSTQWELEFNRVTGAFVFTWRDLQSPSETFTLNYKCTPTEPVLS